MVYGIKLHDRVSRQQAIDKHIEDHLFTSTNEECNLFTRSYLNNLEEANLVKRNKINDHATKR